jgi:hypothetical protein
MTWAFLVKGFIYQYFESAAAKELFEFQVSHPGAMPNYFVLIDTYHLTRGRTPTARSRRFTSRRCVMLWTTEYVDTLSRRSRGYVTTSHQVKMVFIASLNDQVVPLYSGLFTAASHPLILRALYIDGDAYQYVFRFERTYRIIPEFGISFGL